MRCEQWGVDLYLCWWAVVESGANTAECPVKDCLWRDGWVMWVSAHVSWKTRILELSSHYRHTYGGSVYRISRWLVGSTVIIAKERSKHMKGCCCLFKLHFCLFVCLFVRQRPYWLENQPVGTLCWLACTSFSRCGLNSNIMYNHH